MDKILVTGGMGMIGSNLVKKLIKENKEVFVVDNLWRGKLEYLNDESGKPVIPLETHFFNRDLSETGNCDDLAERVDYIIHLANVVAGIDYVFNNQGSLFRKNILINSNVISSARKAKNHLKGFIYVGTACSFPLTRQNTLEVIPLKEELYPVLPESAYGWSKLMGQYETELLEKETGIPTCTLMFHNIYGSPCDFGERSQVIPALVRKAINYPEEPFNVWGSGQQRRAFIHVNDVVESLWLALNKGLGEGVIQIGPSICTSIREIAELIVEISGKDIDIFYDTTKPEGDKVRAADYSKAKRILGWEAKVSLEKGIRLQYDWIKREIEKDLIARGNLYHSMKKYFNVFLEFNPVIADETIRTMIQQKGKGYVCLVESNNLTIANKNPRFQEILNGSLVNICDGSNLAWLLGKIHKEPFKSYIGTDLFLKYVKKRKYKQYFLGNTHNVLDGLKKNLSLLDPAIENMPFEELPFRKVEDFDYKAIAEQINLEKPDIIWVSLGAPKQEEFMSRLLPWLEQGVMFGIGAAFNFNAGAGPVKRAPDWMLNLRLEWLYRALEEPKKNIPRYYNFLKILPRLVKDEYKKKSD